MIQKYVSCFYLQAIPQFNKGKTPAIKGRNTAPSKGDDSVISTTRDIKVRDETVPFNLAAPTNTCEPQPAPSRKSVVQDPRDEMRRRGEEKKRLLAALRPASTEINVQPKPRPDEPSLPLFIMDAPTVVRNDVSRASKKPTSSSKANSKDSKKVKNPIDKSSPKPETNVSSKHTELKRQKMRDRERTKRAKDTERKQGQQQAVSYHTQSQRKTTVPIEGPVDSLREMGSMLAAKLSREKETYLQSYNRM